MGIQRIENKCEEYNEANIKLTVRGEPWGVQLDVFITPLYCHHCKKQLDGFYQHLGSRYGHVGVVNCSCGATINCVDSDNIVEYLNTYTEFQGTPFGEEVIDFRELYQLKNENWMRVKKKIGFDIFTVYPIGTTVSLADVIKSIKKVKELKYPVKSYPSGKFNHLPPIVNQWFSILKSLKYY